MAPHYIPTAIGIGPIMQSASTVPATSPGGLIGTAGESAPQVTTLFDVLISVGSPSNTTATGGYYTMPCDATILSVDCSATAITSTPTASLTNSTQSVTHVTITVVAGSTRATTITTPSVKKGDVLTAVGTAASSKAITAGFLHVLFLVTGPVTNG